MNYLLNGLNIIYIIASYVYIVQFSQTAIINNYSKIPTIYFVNVGKVSGLVAIALSNAANYKCKVDS